MTISYFSVSDLVITKLMTFPQIFVLFLDYMLRSRMFFEFLKKNYVKQFKSVQYYWNFAMEFLFLWKQLNVKPVRD